ncbi:MAG: BldC family transcriptional regulator [Actinobacteria bacterium]|nr:BldC family transcriptional regulator [Actinomycetota bacterium]
MLEGAGQERDDLLTPGEVAKLFGVDPKTVTRWASAGKLSPLRTLGGHRRYRSTEVYALLERSTGGMRPATPPANPLGTSSLGDVLRRD